MKVAILSNFMEFNPGYSLTGIVQDQAWMLTRYDNEVDVFVNEQYVGDDHIGKAQVRKLIPFAHLIDYKSKNDLTAEHREVVERIKQLLLIEIPQYDMVFTHDFIFTGWNLPYAMAIQEVAQAAELKEVRWMHWIHSIPSANSDWWSIEQYGHLHKIVYPNKTDSLRVAEQYRGWPHDVLTIPHIKDLRSWFEFTEETCDFIDDFPAVMEADIVQIFPASVDRLLSKRVKEVILIFAAMKRMGFKICLVVANQWATQTQQKQDVEHYLKIARRNGLVPMEEVIFTSEWRSTKYDAGIPRSMLRELFQCSNLFIFPTREESFGLVVPEAALSGGVLMVLNKSLYQQMEISGMTTLYFDFGSFHNKFEPAIGWATYLNDVAAIIIGRMARNESIMTKNFVRKTYNVDNMYTRYYLPLMSESQVW